METASSLIRRASKILLEVISVAVAATAILLGVLAWQLSSGPVHLSILSQVLEDLIDNELDGGTITIGDTVLTWSPERRQIDMRVVNLVVKGADGNQVAALPQLSFRLSVPALVRGHIAPTSVELYGVKTTLLRRATGLSLGLAAADAPVENNGDVIGPMIEALVSGHADMPVLAYLRRIAIYDGTLTVVDEVNNVTFEAPKANFEIYRGRGGLAATLSADLTLADTTGHIELEGALPEGASTASVDIRATNIVPAALARMSPAFRNYGMVDAPMSATGELDLARNGAVQSARLIVDSGEGRFVIPGLAQAPVDLEKAHADVTLDALAKRVDIKDLTLQAGPHSVEMKGHIDYVMGEGVSVSTATVDLSAGKTTTEIAGFFEGPVTFDNAHVLATIDLDKRMIDAKDITLGVAGGQIEASGLIGEGARSPSLKAKATIGKIPVNEARKVWPLVLSKKSRAWVVKNLKDGDLLDAQFSIDVPADLLEEVEEKHLPIPDGGLRFAFNVQGATVQYIEGMPPLMNVSAKGLVGNNRFDAWVSSAVVNVAPGHVLNVSSGHFEDGELSNHHSIGEIEFTGTGQTADILALLNHEPLHLLNKFGMDPASVGGNGSVHAILHLPLVKGVTLDQIDFNGTARAENVAIPNIQPDLAITSGTLDVAVSRTGLKATGPVGLNGAAPLDLIWTESFVHGVSPSSSYTLSGNIDTAGRRALGLKFDKYIDGPAAINATLTGNGSKITHAKIHADLKESVAQLVYLSWLKPKDEPVTLDVDMEFKPDSYVFTGFTLKGPGTSAHGDFTMNKAWEWMSLNFPVIKLGASNDLAIHGRRDEQGTLQVDINGARADASGLLHNFIAGDGDKVAAAAAAIRVVTPDMVADPARRTVIRANIANVSGQNGTTFTNLDARFTLLDDWTYAFSLDGLDMKQAPFKAGITPDSNQTRLFSMSSTDAGAVFRTLDLARGVTDGVMDAKAKIDDTQPGSPMKGEINVTKFRVINAPVLGKILTLGSLTGIADTLSGDGIYFDKLILPFNVTGHRIHVDDARMSGPAIGLTVKGQIDRTSDVVDLEGTIIPAYTLNSVLGNVPLLGPLLIGREGEGIFAFTFAIKGATANPSVIVNPLSAIAPGVLRRLFEFGSSLPPEAKPNGATQSAPSAPDAATPAPVAPITVSPETPSSSQTAPSSPEKAPDQSVLPPSK